MSDRLAIVISAAAFQDQPRHFARLRGIRHETC
ncbi:hypothetical protein HDC89_003273 [Herbaspirillum sp. SJZ102]|nr:hypothetical protein [Herbaspirillum sp. SJZ102]